MNIHVMCWREVNNTEMHGSDLDIFRMPWGGRDGVLKEENLYCLTLLLKCVSSMKASNTRKVWASAISSEMGKLTDTDDAALTALSPAWRGAKSIKKKSGQTVWRKIQKTMMWPLHKESSCCWRAYGMHWCCEDPLSIHTVDGRRYAWALIIWLVLQMQIAGYRAHVGDGRRREWQSTNPHLAQKREFERSRQREVKI